MNAVQRRNAIRLARKIARRWVARLGLGFHPDTRGHEYVEVQSGERSLSDSEVAAYEAEMTHLFAVQAVGADPYAIALAEFEAWKRTLD